jgi:hypothetical protein
MTTIDLSGAQWRKSSDSNGSGNCVEVATAWRKSSHSGEANGCVEVGQAPARHIIAIRDTTDRDGGTITVSQADWQAFTFTVRQGQAVPIMG